MTGAVTAYERIKADPVLLEERRTMNREYQRDLRAWLAAYKLERGCCDCGYAKEAAALQFDHEGPKTAGIGEIRTSRVRILKEIEDGKCVVRCANCHAEKTAREKREAMVA